MALSMKVASTESLARFCEYADANGYRLSEMPPYGAVHPVHTKGSWHFDTDRWRGKTYGQAVDINAGPVGASVEEMRLLAKLIPVAQSFGLAITLAVHGTYGSAINHRDHAHVDVGVWSNLGSSYFHGPSGDPYVARLQQAVHFYAKRRDNLYGELSHQRVNVVRRASAMHGEKFPKGKKFAQRCVGAERDGVWGPQSRAAHTRTVKNIQRVYKAAGVYSGRIDGIWGRGTERAFRAFATKYGKGL